MKKVLVKAGVILVVLAVIVLVLSFAGPKFGNNQAVSTTVLEEAVVSASELVTVKYYYNDIGTYEDAKTINVSGKDTKIPFTTDEIMFTYGGIISLGIDAADIEFEVNDAAGTITCTIPEIKVVAHEDDEEKFQEYIIKDSIFTKTSWGDYNDIKAELKAEQETIVLSDDEIVSGAEETVKNTISTLLNNAGLTKNYTLIFKFD
ncbi:MAG: DUF4230 domain-containing protein [Clostridiales bacterium]|nr:DUF4230 domain-containing protein [Clostridiales bacterium]